jgi:hypothetical protein
MGDYVSIPQFAGLLTNTDKASSLATEYIDSVMAKGDDLYSRALSLLNALGSFASFNPIDTSVGWVDVPLPTHGSLGDLPIKPTLSDIPAPPISFDFTQTPYVSTLLSALKDKLETDILVGSTGLSLGIEQEIYDRESERDRLELADTMDRIAVRWAESGFTLPDGILTAQTSMADVTYQNQRLDKSRKIAEDSFKTAVENTRFTIEQASKLEDILMRFNTSDNEMKIKAATAILQSGIQIFEALIKEKLANVDLYKAEAQAYEANANALGAIARVDVAYFEAQAGYNAARANVSLKEIEMQIKQLEVQLSINAEIAKAIADVGSRLAAGALSSVNAGVSLGYSGQDSAHTSMSDQINHSEQIQESHEYKHT